MLTSREIVPQIMRRLQVGPAADQLTQIVSELGDICYHSRSGWAPCRMVDTAASLLQHGIQADDISELVRWCKRTFGGSSNGLLVHWIDGGMVERRLASLREWRIR